jgi:hypothetical protein
LNFDRECGSRTESVSSRVKKVQLQSIGKVRKALDKKKRSEYDSNSNCYYIVFDEERRSYAVFASTRANLSCGGGKQPASDRQHVYDALKRRCRSSALARSIVNLNQLADAGRLKKIPLADGSCRFDKTRPRIRTSSARNAAVLRTWRFRSLRSLEETIRA